VLSDGAPTTWLVGEDAVDGLGEVPAAVRVRTLPLGDEGFAPAAVLDLLADLRLGRVLVEGGGRTVSQFVRAGVLDRLHLTVAPVLLGTDGTTGIGLPGPALARDAVRPPSRAFLLGDDVCFDLDLRG
jgi:diaminohydroxyphosphoribosylaminopyrimidine deaminase/5-amino-6-(5-phosphoribosylamino)uracil reductase